MKYFLVFVAVAVVIINMGDAKHHKTTTVKPADGSGEAASVSVKHLALGEAEQCTNEDVRPYVLAMINLFKSKIASVDPIVHKDVTAHPDAETVLRYVAVKIPKDSHKIGFFDFIKTAVNVVANVVNHI